MRKTVLERCPRCCRCFCGDAGVRASAAWCACAVPIESVDGQMLTVKARDGADVKVKLADNAPIRAVAKESLADVKQGSFVGITAMPQPDGTQKAVEIHIFPEAMRGTGEGHRPWDLMPNSTMTNANVDSEVAVSRRQKARSEIQGRRQDIHRAVDTSRS